MSTTELKDTIKKYIIICSKGLILHANFLGGIDLNITPEEIIGKNIFLFANNNQTKKMYQNNINKCLNKEIVNFKIESIINGINYYFEGLMLPVVEDGKVDRILINLIVEREFFIEPRKKVTFEIRESLHKKLKICSTLSNYSMVDIVDSALTTWINTNCLEIENK